MINFFRPNPAPVILDENTGAVVRH
jgi:hypothetical protein